MLDIHQWFYENIWPLKNKKVFLNYKKWNVLVKAPIGTWKSFLFFDWPIFALYKHSDRTIINKDSKKWTIQLLFSVDEDYYLVERKLTQTKTWKDSVKTSLYQIIKDKNFLDYLDSFSEILTNQKNDILTLLKFHQINLENLTPSFKQESELQLALNELLPPKEVALTTIFLPQNSENIFEMTPSTRISILKKVFWILWIDEAKKIIDDKKKEIYWQIKAREDDSTYKDRVVQTLNEIKKLANNLSIFDLAEIKEFFTENEIVWLENLNLDSLGLIENFNYEKYLDKIKEIQNKYTLLNQEIKNLKEQAKQKSEEKENLLKQLNQIQSEIKNLENINQLIESHKKELQDISNKVLIIQNKYKDIQSEYEGFLQKKTILQNLQNNIDEINLKLKKLQKELEKYKNISNYDYEKEIVQLESKISELEKQIEKINNIDFKFFEFNWFIPKDIRELENLFTKIKQEWIFTKQQIEKLQQQIKEVEIELKEILNQQQNKYVFNCEKINWNCPFLDKILSNFSNNFIWKQKEKLQLKLENLNKEYKQFKEKRDNLAKYWKEKQVSKVLENLKQIDDLNNQQKQLTKKLQEYQNKQKLILENKWKLQEIEKQIEVLKSEKQNKNLQINKLKNEIEWLTIEKDYLELQKLKKQKEELTEKISLLTEKSNSILKLKTKKEEIEKQVKTLDLELEKLQKQIKEKENEFVKFKENFEKALQDEKILSELKKQIWVYNEIIKDYKNSKLKLLELKKKYSLLKDLSNIFWKELVIYVFSDYLKWLEELINFFISDIVNFTLHIQLDEKWENLDIFVEDEYWIRPVNSLSWWQKTALRIWWILGISRLQNSKVLFLDETINNFDQESVQLLAEKIKEFVNQYDMKFYMITHSEILQQADIWTDVVQLKLEE